MKYYISDLHFNHKNVTNEGRNFDNRPFDTLEEMHKTIETKWNSKITNDDDVYILGDVVWIKDESIISLISRLKGYKHLIIGNHEKPILKEYRLKSLFEEIDYYKEIRDVVNGKQVSVVLSHYPIMMWNGQHKGAIHLFGHLHNSIENNLYYKFLEELKRTTIKTSDKDKNFDPIAINVGCMLPYMDYEPKSLQELLDN